jgi:hypothetical protein
MDILLLILGIVLIIGGIIGCILPILPGPPISYGGLLLVHFAEKWQFTAQTLLILGLITVLVTILDYFVPIWGTKRFGGSKAGINGSTVGLILGLLFFPPLGMIIGPFVGAVIGEMIAKNDTATALRSGFGSFIGFLMGTGMKLATSGVIAFYFVKEVV